ncbi:N-acetyl sugar amidotransferase [Candidatus Woesearchaeota archaeon]|nr:N-acetyl sugar amidotransferase [Candidatus Woesearchaeota archaeon]
MRYCKRCLFPDTKPDIFFDDEGICDACRSAERKNGIENAIDWKKREEEFKSIIDKYRSKDGMNYDCIVPVSGGKDSCFQVYAMKVIHNMNPLAVTFDQFDKTETSQHDLQVLREIGVDHIHFTMNPKIVRKLVKKGFEIVGDHYWVNHVGIYTVPAIVAVNYQIPLIIWGENPQLEYGGPAASRDNQILDRKWRQEFGLMRGFREEDMVDDDIQLSDLKSMVYPSDEKIASVGVTGLFYGYFFKWNAREHLKIVESLGWKRLPKAWQGSWLDYENCDMEFIDIREHMKWLKYGYGRTTDQVNIDIRNGVITRKEGLEIVKNNDGKVDSKHIDDFCKYIGITKQEYQDVIDTFVNTDIFEKDENGNWKLKQEVN